MQLDDHIEKIDNEKDAELSLHVENEHMSLRKTSSSDSNGAINNMDDKKKGLFYLDFLMLFHRL